MAAVGARLGLNDPWRQDFIEFYVLKAAFLLHNGLSTHQCLTRLCDRVGRSVLSWLQNHLPPIALICPMFNVVMVTGYACPWKLPPALSVATDKLTGLAA